MATINQTAPAATAAAWTGRILSGVVILFLLVDGAMKLVPLDIVTQTMQQLGYPPNANLARLLGLLTLAGTLLYAYPRTSILGAIVLTGYMGGTMATHLQAGSPVFSHLLFGFYLGLMIWSGLYLRDERLRTLIPFRL
jgi:uncharacterized membrane protein YphA (DoxX/SURF4 family)